MRIVQILAGLLLAAGAVSAGVVEQCTPWTLRPHPPRWLHCNQYGSLNRHKVSSLGRFNSGTQDFCIEFCLNDFDCIAYGFEPSTGDCHGYGKPLAQQGFRSAPSGSVVFANRNCYGCPTNPPATTTTTTTSSSTSTASSSTSTTSSSTSQATPQCTAYNLQATGGSSTNVLGEVIGVGDETDQGGTSYAYFEPRGDGTSLAFDSTTGHFSDFNKPDQILGVTLTLPTCAGDNCLVGDNMLVTLGRANDTITTTPLTCTIDSSSAQVGCEASYGGYTWTNWNVQPANCRDCYALQISDDNLAPTVIMSALNVVFDCPTPLPSS